MAGLGDIFKKGSIAEQLVVWQVLAQLAQPIMNPVIQTLANDLWTADPNVPVIPEIMAQAVARGLTDMADGINESSKSGVGDPQFRRMVKVAQNSPTLTELVELWRRGLIGEGAPGDRGTSFYAAMTDAGVRPEWIPLLAQLKVNKPTGEAALNALLQGQIPRERAYALWLQAGEDPDWFQDAFNSQGTAPTPDMAGTMANRRIIPWDGEGPNAVSFRQAFLEGPWRNKWEAPMRKLMQYLTPPRSVVAMLRSGSLTDQRALELLEMQGLTAGDAAAYIAEAHHTHTTADKTLAKTEIVALYKAHKIDQAQAVGLLRALKYSPANAALIISLADMQKADAHLTAAINRVHTLYTAHKISRAAAVTSLAELKVPAAQSASMLTLWDLETAVNVKQLTEAQIVAAWYRKIMTEAEAMTELQHLGYTAYDAWVLLSIRNAGPLPAKPAIGPGPGMNP